MDSKWLLLAGVTFLLAFCTAAAGSAQEGATTVAAASPDSVPADQGTGQPVLQQRHPRYQVQPGDVLDISFTFTPEYNRTVTVQPDGYINLRDLPDMLVVGKTTPELREMIRQAYARVLHDPVITLELKEFEKPYFIAGGQVGKPGKYDLLGDTTVVQAIAIAGGFNETSKHSQVLLFRRLDNDWVEAKKVDVKEMLHTANLREDLHLRPGDMIFVPKNTISKLEPYIPKFNLGLYLNQW
ncbi:MAG TPA: polysaccharide biosynthesis/export family protein [Terriglobia bacterium]|nr:polysaccharide biosynthesis/export family protein [Terriglobia bacterium]